MQTHSHTHTCRKKGGTCRFGYPKPVSERTILSRPSNDSNSQKRKNAINTLTKVKEFLEKCDIQTTDLNVSSLLELASVDSKAYYEALQNATSSPTVFTKRQPHETCINNYNPDILTLWKANMDLQYVTSPYAAIAYITSYITKEEREAGTILHALSKELKDLNIKQQMRKVASTFTNARNVSAQEASYRILGLPLHMSNFKIVWIPSGFPEKRIRIIKPKHLLESLDETDEDVFCSKIIDRYSARPTQVQHMCLAEFAMWYEPCRNNTDQSDNEEDNVIPQDKPEEDTIETYQQQPQTIQLSGYEKMKRRSSPAVIRFHQCSQSKDSEQYSYNRMLLFMPWRREKEDLIDIYDTYTSHYQSKKMILKKHIIP